MDLYSYSCLKQLMVGNGGSLCSFVPCHPYIPHPLPLCCNYPAKKCLSVSVAMTSTLWVTCHVVAHRFMTDKILLHKSKGDPLFEEYSVIILDEAHQRTLATDILMGLMKDLVATRTEARVIIMGAELDYEKFQVCKIISALQSDWSKCELIPVMAPVMCAEMILSLFLVEDPRWQAKCHQYMWLTGAYNLEIGHFQKWLA